MKLTKITLIALCCSFAATGCVKKSVFEEQTAKLNETAKTLQLTQDELDATNKKLAAKENDYNKLTADKQTTDDKLALAMNRNAELSSQLTTLGQNVEELSDERSRLTDERSRMEEELESLRRLRAAAEKQNAQYATMLNKLKSMIDAGTLKIGLRKGQMIVQLSNDILFAPGGTKLKQEGKDAIVALAETIAEFKDRRFLVVGHSDDTQINTPRFPSNWELSAQRAIEVVKILIDNGVSAENLIASGNAEFDPIAPNDTADNKAVNRRVEVVFMPSIEELPTTNDESAANNNNAAAAPAAPAAN